MLRRASVAMAALASLALSCGGGPRRVGGQPRWRKVETGEQVAGSKEIARTITFTPTTAGSEQ